MGTQTHAWKVMMVVMHDPLDTNLHIRKYVSGQCPNNIIEIALRCDLVRPEENVQNSIIEIGEEADGFSSDLDPADLSAIFAANKIATQSSSADAPPEKLHSTLAIEPNPVLQQPSVPMVIDDPSLPTPKSKTPKNPKKKLKLEVDRDVANALAQSLSSFATLLQIKDDSSGDSFEVVSDEKSDSEVAQK